MRTYVYTVYIVTYRYEDTETIWIVTKLYVGGPLSNMIALVSDCK
jgi:hypothetical protein